MAVTDFGRMQSQKKIMWSKTLWKEARDRSFTKRFTGSSNNSIIQRITELTKDERGERVIMQLVAELQGDGGVDDDEREGHEEEMLAYEQQIGIGLINHGVKDRGKMSTQKSILRFRELGMDKLAEWLKNMIDQLAILTLSGVSYAYRLNGAARDLTSRLTQLDFASMVSAPTANRHFRFDGTDLQAGDTTAITSGHVLKYGAIVELVARMRATYMRGMNAYDAEAGDEKYVMLIHPLAFAQLKLDPDYQRAVITAAPRSKDNPWFNGSAQTIDGVVFHQHRLTFNTLGAGAGQKWGSGGAINGTRSLLLGAQALGMADLGPPDWVEEQFQYKSQKGINVDKMLGFLKPKYPNSHTGTIEDFGVCALDSYIKG